MSWQVEQMRVRVPVLSPHCQADAGATVSATVVCQAVFRVSMGWVPVPSAPGLWFEVDSPWHPSQRAAVGMGVAPPLLIAVRFSGAAAPSVPWTVWQVWHRTWLEAFRCPPRPQEVLVATPGLAATATVKALSIVAMKFIRVTSVAVDCVGCWEPRELMLLAVPRTGVLFGRLLWQKAQFS